MGGFMTDARLVRLVEKGVLELVVWENTWLIGFYP